MLEQPPEKSDLEIAAEIAAREEQQILAPSRTLKFFRTMIWCSPLFACIMIAAAYIWLMMQIQILREETIAFTTIVVSILVSIYAIGYFDGMLCSKTYSSHQKTRHGNIHFHALKFVAYQFLIIPALYIMICLFVALCLGLFG